LTEFVYNNVKHEVVGFTGDDSGRSFQAGSICVPALSLVSVPERRYIISPSFLLTKCLKFGSCTSTIEIIGKKPSSGRQWHTHSDLSCARFIGLGILNEADLVVCGYALGIISVYQLNNLCENQINRQLTEGTP
jgi:hypothetical protein